MRYPKLALFIAFPTGFVRPATADVSIEQCVEKARENYPLIKQYGLLDSFCEIDLSDINKNWLPKISVYGQMTGQNVVPSYPSVLSDILKQMGQSVDGLSKIQYKIGLDLNQNIWDGGVSAASRKLTKTKNEVSRASLEVELYKLRERVESIYFAIILMQEQISESRITTGLLEANLLKLQAMLKNGTAMQSDCDMVEAQLLVLKQKIVEAEYNCQGLLSMLELFTGENLRDESLVTPQYVDAEGNGARRPEMKLFEKREQLALLYDEMTATTLRPKIGFFAQAYYGYPGFDYFKSMMSRSLSFNLMAGIKISWNVDAFYNRNNSHRKTLLNSENIGIERNVFLFNTNIASEQQRYAIEGLKKSMADDSRILELRGNVRKAAESQLENGVIDATALLSKISDENIAALNAKLHKIQYLQELYKLKYILNE